MIGSRHSTQSKGGLRGHQGGGWSTAILGLSALGGALASHHPPAHMGPAAHATAHVRFEENRGQLDPAIRFIARTGGIQAAVLGAETILRAGDEVVTLTMRGARSDAHVSGDGLLPGVTNYRIGPDPSRWASGVPSFARVRVDDVYPGIDLVHHSDGGRLEYDLVVEPGVDPSVVELAIRGAERVELDDAGHLSLHTTSGTVIKQLEPAVYQDIAGERIRVEGSYVLASLDDGQVGVRFELGPYDRDARLVIDPIVYASYLGGDGADRANAIAATADGGIVIAGRTASSDFPGATKAASGEDMFVTKLDAEGAIEFTTLFGGSGNDTAKGIAVAPDGKLHAVGYTDSADAPVTPGAFQPAFGGVTDLFYARLSATGAIELASYIGSSDFDGGGAIAVDADGNAIVGGSTGAPDLFTTPGAFATTFTGPSDGFLVKVSPAGERLWSTFLGSDQGANADAVAVDDAGRVYVAGTTGSTMLPITPDAIDDTLGFIDGFVMVLDAAGSALEYGTYFGGSDFEQIFSIALDDDDNMYIVGQTMSADFPTSTGALKTTMTGGSDGFVIALNGLDAASNPGGVMASTFVGGDADDSAAGVTVLKDAQIGVVTFTTSPTGWPVSADAPQPEMGTAASSAFVSTLTPDLASSSFGTYYGSSDTTQPIGIAPGSIWLVAVTNSASALVSANAAQPAKSGGDDAVVVKLDNATSTGPYVDLVVTGVVPKATSDGEEFTVSTGPATLVLQLSNAGTQTATNVILKSDVPYGLGLDAKVADGTGCELFDDKAKLVSKLSHQTNGQEVSVSIDSVKPKFAMTCTFPVALPAGGLYDILTTGDADEPDHKSSDNTHLFELTVVGKDPSDDVATKKPGGCSYDPGATRTWQSLLSGSLIVAAAAWARRRRRRSATR